MPAALERRPGLDARDRPQRRLHDPGHDLVLHERHDDEEADHAEDDAGDGGQHLNAHADDLAHGRVDELDEQQRDDERERHGDDHRDHGRESRAGQRRERAVVAQGRRPVHRREDLGPEAGDRRPRVVDEDRRQAEHSHRDGEAARGGDDPEDGVAEPEAARAAPPWRRRANPSDWRDVGLRTHGPCLRSLGSGSAASLPHGRAAGRDVLPHVALDEVVDVLAGSARSRGSWPWPHRSCRPSRRSSAWPWRRSRPSGPSARG